MEKIDLPDGKGHEACNQTIQDLLKVIESQRELLKSTMERFDTAIKTIGIISSLLALMPSAKSEKQGRGRPAKRANDSELLKTFNNTMMPEFVSANPSTKSTDSAVLTWYFTKEFSRYGMSASRVRGKVFQSKLKTLKNRIGNARNPLPKLPIK